MLCGRLLAPVFMMEADLMLTSPSLCSPMSCCQSAEGSTSEPPWPYAACGNKACLRIQHLNQKPHKSCLGRLKCMNVVTTSFDVTQHSTNVDSLARVSAQLQLSTSQHSSAQHSTAQHISAHACLYTQDDISYFLLAEMYECSHYKL